MSSSDRGPRLDERVATRRRTPADTRRMAEALSDPLRADIFDVLAGWMHSGTVRQIAQFLDQPADAVSRELAVLEASDLVEPLADAAAGRDDSPPYRATRDGVFDDEEWAEFPAELRVRFHARLLDKMHARIRSALANGGFDAPDVHVSWIPTDLDGLGYQDVARLLVETSQRAQDIQVAAVERRREGSADDEVIRSSIMLVHFLDESAPRAEEPPAPLLERVFELTEAIAEEVPRKAPDWHRIADSATALAALARRRANANVVR